MKDSDINLLFFLAKGHKVTVDWLWGRRCRNYNNCQPILPNYSVILKVHTYILCKQGSRSNNKTCRAAGLTPMMQKNTPVERDIKTSLKVVNNEHYALDCTFFFTVGPRPNGGNDLLVLEVSRSRSDTPHSVGLLWTSDQRAAETPT